MKKVITLLSLLFLLNVSVYAGDNSELETVPYLDVPSYMGVWYEIASYPHHFQKNCTATQATYKLRDDNEIDVINQCRLGGPSGKLKRAKARGWVVDKESNSKLKVQFFLRQIRLPIFAGDYWVILLDDLNYLYSVVSGPRMDSLWILSRTKKMEEELYLSILDKLREKGFDLSKLQKTVH